MKTKNAIQDFHDSSFPIHLKRENYIDLQSIRVWLSQVRERNENKEFKKWNQIKNKVCFSSLKGCRRKKNISTLTK